jgi:tyrosyl-tRNA synthetase
LTIPISEVEWSVSKGMERPILGRSYRGVKMDRLLVKCGLAESTSDAARKIKQGAVRVGNQVHEGIYFLVEALPIRLLLRVGKRVKIAVIHR